MEHTKNGIFSIKSAYLLRFEAQFVGVFRREQVRFPSWNRVWSLGLPPKFQFIWKVIHCIVAVKDALLRINIHVDPVCPLCKQALETIEHLFLNCDFARRVWGASHLGFDFSMGSAVGFSQWFDKWLKEAPD